MKNKSINQLIEQKSVFIIVIVLLIISFIGTSCGKTKPVNGSNSVSNSDTISSTDEVFTTLSFPAISDVRYNKLAKKATDGDADAAYLLYNSFTYGASRNYGLAYYWCKKAISLGDDRLSVKNLELAEKNILNEAFSSSTSGLRSVDIENVLPRE